MSQLTTFSGCLANLLCCVPISAWAAEVRTIVPFISKMFLLFIYYFILGFFWPYTEELRVYSCYCAQGSWQMLGKHYGVSGMEPESMILHEGRGCVQCWGFLGPLQGFPRSHSAVLKREFPGIYFLVLGDYKVMGIESGLVLFPELSVHMHLSLNRSNAGWRRRIRELKVWCLARWCISEAIRSLCGLGT